MAWVLTLTRDLADGTAFEWIYGARKRVTNIDQAMTLVSEEVRVFLVRWLTRAICRPNEPAIPTTCLTPSKFGRSKRLPCASRR